MTSQKMPLFIFQFTLGFLTGSVFGFAGQAIPKVISSFYLYSTKGIWIISASLLLAIMIGIHFAINGSYRTLMSEVRFTKTYEGPFSRRRVRIAQLCFWSAAALGLWTGITGTDDLFVGPF